MQKQATNWLELLPLALCCLNDLPGPAGFSPHRLVFGRDAIGFGDCPPVSVAQGSEDARTFFQRLVSERAQVRKKLTAIHNKLTEAHNYRSPLTVYTPGERVLICRDPKGRDRGMNKLERLWNGPFEVMERVGRGRYRISAEKGETIVPVSIMKPFRDPVSGNRVPLHFYTDREEMVHSESFIVEKILPHRKRGKKVEWEVKFQGYPETEWHSVESFLHDVNEDWQKYNATRGLESTLQGGKWVTTKITNGRAVREIQGLVKNAKEQSPFTLLPHREYSASLRQILWQDPEYVHLYETWHAHSQKQGYQGTVLPREERRRSGVRPMCAAQFSSQNRLHQHIRTVHSR